MKKLVVVFLCFFASNTFASSADSGKCPWKIPFTISIYGLGNGYVWHEYTTPLPGSFIVHDTNYEVPFSNDDFQITVDTSLNNKNQLEVGKDFLLFSQHDTSVYGSPPGITTLMIDFAPGKDSIISINIKKIDSVYNNYPPNGNPWSDQIEILSFNIVSLLFDDSTIYTNDSSLFDHKISMTDTGYNNWYKGFGSYDYLTNYFTASSVALSGIFRPTTFSDPPAIVTEAPQPNNLAIYASNGSIACSFDVSDHAKDVEIFSPLGIREASFTIQTGQTEASLPHLPPGFYFVWLEGWIAKVYIGE